MKLTNESQRYETYTKCRFLNTVRVARLHSRSMTCSNAWKKSEYSARNALRSSAPCRANKRDFMKSAIKRHCFTFRCILLMNGINLLINAIICYMGHFVLIHEIARLTSCTFLFQLYESATNCMSWPIKGHLT